LKELIVGWAWLLIGPCTRRSEIDHCCFTDAFLMIRADSSETIRKTLRLGWIFFLSAACFMIFGVVLFRLNIAEKSFA
jgi:hypothetical protein